MKRTILLLAGMASLAFAASGCAPTIRSVTHMSTWKGGNGPYIYIGYAENSDVSKLKRCAVNADNTMTCAEEDDVNKLLNNKDKK